MSIGPVKESSLSLPRRVATTLRDAIQSGQIAAGERLPMETHLAERLGVSRATLRDGPRILEAEGLIVRRGGVTWAQPVDLPKAPGQFGFAPLSETDRERLASALTETLDQSSLG